MLDSLEPRRYQSAVLLGPRSVAHLTLKGAGGSKGGVPQFYRPGLPGGLGTRTSRNPRGEHPRQRLARLLVQNQGSQQVSPQSASGLPDAWASAQVNGVEAAVCFAGVAQLVEHLFCKQVVRGSSPRASSFGVQSPKTAAVARSRHVSKVSESCPSGQREQAVNLPAYAYAGSNPALSTEAPLLGASVSMSFPGSSAPPRRSEFGGAPPQVLRPSPKTEPLNGPTRHIAPRPPRKAT